MGQKVNPKSFRLGPVYTWDSRWFTTDKKRYRQLLMSDQAIRTALTKRLVQVGLARIEIERSINTVEITLHVARPGMVIGRGGQGLEELKKFVEKIVKDNVQNVKVELHVEPVKEPNLDAHLVATNISEQLIRTMPYKRVVNQAIEKVMGAKAKGVKILLAGRIAGAEIARRELHHEGVVPLSTIREKVDFAKVSSLTKSGYIGVKVWICKN